MLPVGEATVFAKKNVFWSYNGHKTAAAIVSDFGRADLVAKGGMRIRLCDADYG